MRRPVPDSSIHRIHVGCRDMSQCGRAIKTRAAQSARMHLPAEAEFTGATRAAPVICWSHQAARVVRTDRVAREEPLELRVNGRSVAVVMRTPGHERELAAGFLLSEGVIRTRDDLLDILICRDLPHGKSGNVVDVLLAPGVEVDFERLSRNTFAASSCGICGKATLDSVFARIAPVPATVVFSPSTLTTLPARLRELQPDFGLTGGMHASALFDLNGHVCEAREDVGRHNALDKLIGRALLENRLPLVGHGLMLSGRVSFELVQKAIAAGIGLVAGIGAPSSLAIDCASEGGVTLVGFLRQERMNVYAGPARLGLDASGDRQKEEMR